MKLDDLHAEFDRGAVSWRAQSVTRDGTKAMALAYIDARDVMQRLDDVCGAANWQDSYEETAKGRVLCNILIRIDDQWVSKSDGAGESDIEGEKGGISGAFKRAAVKWGIGRYLYDTPTPWVPCESYEKNGKFYWRKWKEDPWSYVTNKAPVDLSEQRARNKAINDIRAVVNLDDLATLWKGLGPAMQHDADVFAEKETRKAELAAQEFHQGAG